MQSTSAGVTESLSSAHSLSVRGLAALWWRRRRRRRPAAHLSAQVCEGLCVAQPQSFQIKQNLEKEKEETKRGKEIKQRMGVGGGKGGITDLRCHLLYEVDGVIYVEADHTAQWNLR